MSGKGTRYYHGEHLIYNGDWKNGMRDGQGTLFVNSKDKLTQWVYQGHWKDH